MFSMASRCAKRSGVAASASDARRRRCPGRERGGGAARVAPSRWQQHRRRRARVCSARWPLYLKRGRTLRCASTLALLRVRVCVRL